MSKDINLKFCFKHINILRVLRLALTMAFIAGKKNARQAPLSL